MPEKEKPPINPADLRRRDKPPVTPEDGKNPPGVSAGAIGPRMVDYIFNATREKLREVTSVTQIEAQLLPQIDVVDTMWKYAIEVAYYRQNADNYKRLFGQERPVPPDPIGEWIYRKAQWNKSIQGMNLKAGIDITLAETEARMGGEEGLGDGADAWKD